MKDVCRVKDCSSTRAYPSATCSHHRYLRSLELRPHRERYKRNKENNPNWLTNNTYWHMRQRCENPNVDRYPRYGGRGIKVCERWQEFEKFLEDMGRCPPGYTLERINVDGDYEPSNCRWATKQEQARNKGVYSNNRSGYSGVTQRYNGSWLAKISIDGESVHIGYFKDRGDAISARLGAEQSLW